MNVLPQEHVEEMVSCSSPLDVCRKLIMSRSFWSAAIFNNVRDRFLSAELISPQAVSDQWIFYDPCEKIDSDTLQVFPTMKVCTFLSKNLLIIDDCAMVINSFFLIVTCPKRKTVTCKI